MTAHEALTGSSRSDVVSHDAEDPRLIEAIAEAQRTLSAFYKHLQDFPLDDSAMLKVRTDTGSRVEHLWVADVAREAGQLSGTIAVEPIDSTRYQYGDPLTFDAADISDWAWIEDGRMVGGFTLQVLEPEN